MDKQFTYFLILFLSLAGPVALSFDKKVAFHTKWKYLPVPMLVPALLYMAWDMYFVKQGVWSFNPLYITGWHIGNLPVEEVLFFFIVPYSCVFIYECIRCYFPHLKDNRRADQFLWMLAAGLICTGAFYHDRYYTSWTFLFTGCFIVALYLFRKFFTGFDAVSFLVSYVIILLPFLVVNGLLTSIPVVIYNDAENLGKRIYTIPFEDIFYGMLLILANVALFERARAGLTGSSSL